MLVSSLPLLCSPHLRDTTLLPLPSCCLSEYRLPNSQPGVCGPLNSDPSLVFCPSRSPGSSLSELQLRPGMGWPLPHLSAFPIQPLPQPPTLSLAARGPALTVVGAWVWGGGAGHDPRQSSKAGIESPEEGQGTCLWYLLPQTVSPGTTDKERPLGSIETLLPSLFPTRCQQFLLTGQDQTWQRRLESQTGPQLKGPAAAGQMVLEY